MLKKGVDNCPVCGNEWAIDRLEKHHHEQAAYIGDPPSDKVQRLVVYRCISPQCGWAIPVDSDPQLKLVHDPELEIPDCPRGHRFHWICNRQIGRRLMLECAYPDLQSLRVCGATQTFWIGGVGGFRHHTSPRNTVKVAVLAALEAAGDRGATVADLQLMTGLSLGQLYGYLNRAVNVKIPLVELADHVRYVPPHHTAKVYRIRQTGRVFLGYAEARGLINGAA